MADDPAIQLAIDVAVAEDSLAPLLAGLIRVALGRRSVLVAARDAALLLAEEGSAAHAVAAERLERALAFRNLWGDG